MKKILITFLLIFCLSIISSIDTNNACDAAKDYESEVVGIKIPEKIPLQNEIINLYDLEENELGSLSIENGTISSFDCSENENVTYKIYIKDSQTIKDFQNTEDALDLYNEKIKNKEIKIEGVGFAKKTKLFFGKIGLKILSWFN